MHDIHDGTSNSEKNIIIVEDNEINTELLVLLLDKFGFKIDIAENGQIFLDMIKENSYDLIFMDCQMPVLNGYDATQQYRKSENPNARIPIIAVTANGMSEDEEKCLACGMNDYIAKPVKQEILEQKTLFWLNVKNRPHSK